MAVDKRRNRRGQLMTGKVETAHNFPRHILGGILRPFLVEFKHETEALEPQWITADRPRDDVGASASALASA
jgi:hypothetical protein